jgi:2-polyprenyl-3-methyl-5-hydroxy-6-metoxy-1,4-benzoquinol methylase
MAYPQQADDLRAEARVSYPERIVPDETEPGVVALHVKRYEFALPYCDGRDVLDAGCGVGYGTVLLAERASSVVGIDRSAEAIEYARRRYKRPNLEFRTGDLLALDLDDASFDAVTSFEVLEHLRDQERFLAELARVLRPGGVLVLSTPRVPETTDRPDNPFHERELSRADFVELLERHFAQVELYGQRRRETRRHELLRRLDVLGLRRRVGVLRRASGAVTGSPATDFLSTDDVLIERDGVERATELVAVARR